MDTNNTFPTASLNVRYYFAIKIDLIAKALAIFAFFALPISTSATWISAYSAALLTLLNGNFREKFEFIFSQKVAYVFVGIFLLALISMTYTIASQHVALTALKHEFKYIAAILLLPLFTQQRTRQYALYAFLCAAALTIIVAYCKYFGQMPLKVHKGIDGAFKNHIQTSFILTMAAYFWAQSLVFPPPASELYLSRMGKIDESAKNTLLNKIIILRKLARVGLIIFITLACFEILFISHSRTGYVILFTTALLFCWQNFRLKGLVFSLIACLSAFIIMISTPTPVQNQMHNTLHNMHTKNTSVYLRLGYYKEAWHYIKKHPFIGSGTGSITSVSENAMPNSLITHNFHNEYFNMWVQYGIFGIIAIFLLFYFSLKDCQKLPIRFKQIVQATVVVIAVGSLFNSWLMDATEGYFFCLFITLAMASRTRKKS